MVLVFLFIGLIIFFALMIFILLLSSLKIKIEKLHISNISGKFKIEFVSKISIYIFHKFKIYERKIDNKKAKNIITNKKLNIKKFKYTDTIEFINNNEIFIEELNMVGGLGLEDAAYTAYLITFINTVISIIISKKICYYSSKKYNYHIKPLYINQNIVNLELNCIISIKIVNIISIIFSILMKGRVKNNERTSNRGNYAYSHE